MLTIFTIPKAFKVDRKAIQQTNALNSWGQLAPGVEIFLCGDDPGVSAAAAAAQAKHLPDVECNEFGTPFLSSAFARVRREARYETLLYLNADILLTSSFGRTLALVGHSDFLGVCMRRNLDLETPLDFNNPAWESALLELAATKYALNHPLLSRPAAATMKLLRRS